MTELASALPPDVNARHHAPADSGEGPSSHGKIIEEAKQAINTLRKKEVVKNDGSKSKTVRDWVLRLSWCGIALAILLFLFRFLLLLSERLVQTEWTMHTEFPQHMTSRADVFQPYPDAELTSRHFGPDSLDMMGCKAVGFVTLISKTTVPTRQVLDDVLYCSEASTKGLLSIGQLAEQRMEFWRFTPDRFGKGTEVVFSGGVELVTEKDARNVIMLKAMAVKVRPGMIAGMNGLARELCKGMVETIQNARQYIW